MTLRTPSRMLFLLILPMLLLPHPASAADQRKYMRTVERYSVPDVTLVNQDGEKVRLPELLNANETVLVDFVFTTCTTICPLLSIGFIDFQKKLGPDAEKVQLVSISIDPEHDTPKLLKAYLEKYEARPGWVFLTGNRADIDKVLKAFQAYTPNKMSHRPLILMRSRSGPEWVRINGLIRTSDLLREYEKVQQ